MNKVQCIHDGSEYVDPSPRSTFSNSLHALVREFPDSLQYCIYSYMELLIESLIEESSDALLPSLTKLQEQLDSIKAIESIP